MVTEFLEWLANLPPELLILTVGLLVAAETTLGVGMLAPGETGLVLAGTTATTPARFLAMWAVTVTCAIAGYCIAYAAGRYFGPRLRQTKVLQRYRSPSWDRATHVLRRYGAPAVMIAIYLPVLRTLVPAAAGAARLPFRSFLPSAAVAGSTWCALHLLLGAAAGTAARQIEQSLEYGTWIVLGLLVAGVLLIAWRKRRAHACAAAVPSGVHVEPDVPADQQPAGRG